MNKNTINTRQFFSMLFIGRFLIILIINYNIMGGTNFKDNIISAIIAFILNFIIIIPQYFLYKKDNSNSVPEQAINNFGKIGKLFAGFYGIYFIIIGGVFLSLFLLFIKNSMDPNISIFIEAFLIIGVACYCAILGFETIARSSVIVTIFLMIGAIITLLLLSNNIDSLNYQPFFINGSKQTVNGVISFLGYSTAFSAIAVFRPRVKGNFFKGFVWWNIAVYAFVIITLIIAIGACGDYLGYQLFPIYSAVSVARSKVIERMDIFFIITWISGLYIKGSIECYAFSYCSKLIYPNSKSKISMIVCMFAIIILGIIITNSYNIQKFFYNNIFLLCLSFTGAFILPLILLICRRKNNESKE